MNFLILSTVFFFSVACQALPKSPPVKEIALKFPGSKLFVPNDGKPHPGIIILHGSEGGSLPYSHLDAQVLAADGFSVLAFCWYNCRKNPITQPHGMLMSVKLEYTINALKWLKQSKFVDGKKVGLYGFSRGAEQTLIISAIDADDSSFEIDAIAAHAPSDVIVPGFSWAWQDSRCWLCKDDTKNCAGSKDYSLFKWNPFCGKNPRTFPDPNKIPAWTHNDTPLTIGERIQVEKFPGAILITHGEEDKVWSVDRTKRIEASLKSYGKDANIHYFPGEGHNFSSKEEHKRKELVHTFFKRHLQ